LPTVTVTVAALAVIGLKTNIGKIITIIKAMRGEELFIASIIALNLQKTSRCMQP
jgi:hypothetical protein